MKESLQHCCLIAWVLLDICGLLGFLFDFLYDGELTWYSRAWLWINAIILIILTIYAFT